jgi:hypothetical protein
MTRGDSFQGVKAVPVVIVRVMIMIVQKQDACLKVQQSDREQHEESGFSDK